jgi:hypothetical protein
VAGVAQVKADWPAPTVVSIGSVVTPDESARAVGIMQESLAGAGGGAENSS